MHRNEKAAMPEPIKIINKDIPILARVLTAMRDVTNVEQMRDWQRERMYSITQHLSGMPGGGSFPKGLDDAFAKISELNDEQRQKCKKYMEELRRAESILNAIPSANMRTFVMMKYVLAIPNVQIMRELNMTEWKFNQARQKIEEAESMGKVAWRERFCLAEPSKKN